MDQNNNKRYLVQNPVLKLEFQGLEKTYHAKK